MVVTDTVPLLADSLALPDSILVLADTLGADSLAADTVAADSGVVRVLPVFPQAPAPSFAAGVWEWGPEQLIVNEALTVGELLVQIPGINFHRGGDYGMPTAVSSFGMAGGRTRIYFDGIEIPPMEGGVPDLSRIELSGLGRIRVSRRLGEIRVDLHSRVWEEPRPYSIVQAGTGDLDTNVFGFTYVDADALRGSLGVSIDRVDTDGPGRQFPSTSSGFWARYAVHFGDRGGIQIQARRRDTRRGDAYFPDGTRQSDLAGRIRYRFAQGLVAESYVTSHTLTLIGPDAESEIPDDSLRFSTDPRHQVGARVGFEGAGFWVDGEARLQGGRGWPERELRIAGGLDGRAWGGLAGSFEQESWRQGGSGTDLNVHAWTPTFAGFRAFAEWQDDRRGVPEFGLNRTYLPEFGDDPDAVIDTLTVPTFTERSGIRIGADFARWGLTLGGAYLRTEADSLAVFGLAPDRDGLTLPGGSRSGFEVSGSIPLYFDGLSLTGSFVSWNQEMTDPDAWRYLPSRVWDGAVRYHGQFRPSGNLEIDAAVGVRGRDAMLVPFEAEVEEENPLVAAGPRSALDDDPIQLGSVPFYQNWWASLNIRIVTVRAFLRIENIQNRLDNQDYPGRLLPGFRTVYGLRWVMMN